MATTADLHSDLATGATRTWRGFPLPRTLPHLGGRRGSVIAAVYLLLAAATLAIFAGSVWSNSRDALVNAPAAVRFGFRTVTVENGHALIGGVTQEAAARGLRQYDRIIAANGVPVPAGADEFEIGKRLSAVEGDQLTLLIADGAKPPRTVVLDGSGGKWWRTDPFANMPLWISTSVQLLLQPQLVLVLAALLLFKRRRRDPETVLFAFAFLLLNWMGPLLWWLRPFGVPLGYLSVLGGLGWLISLIALAGFPDGRFVSALSRWTLVGVLLQIALMVLDVAGILPPLLAGAAQLLLVLLTAMACASVIIRYRRASPGMERQQIKWAAGGFCVSVLTVTAMLILQMLAGPEGVQGAVGYLFNTVGSFLAFGALPAGLLISLLRYRLYDADAVISRSAGYTLLTLLLGASFAGFAKGAEAFFDTYFGDQAGALPGAVAAGLAVALITPMHKRIHSWAEARFQKALVRLRRDLPDCVGDLRETAVASELVEEVLDRVTSGVRATRVTLISDGVVLGSREVAGPAVDAWLASATLPDTATEIDCNKADPLFPVRVPLRVRHGSGAPLGWLLLGPRPDGSLYGRDEREVLVEIADPVARALRIVQLRDTRESEHNARMARLEAELAAALATIRGGLPSPA